MSRVKTTPVKNRPYYLSDSQRQSNQKYERHYNNVSKHRVSVPSRVRYMSPTPSVVTGKNHKKPWKNGRNLRTPFGHTEPYNYSDTVPLKQFPVATANYAPTGITIASVDLISALGAGTSDNTRLGDTVVVDYVDVNLIAINNFVSQANATATTDISFRWLIVGSKTNVRVDPLTSIDGYGTVNNSIVTTDAMIFFDSGIQNLTPNHGNSGTSYAAPTGVLQLYHNSYRLSKRISLHNRKAAGLFVQFNGATLVAGSLFAIFYSTNGSNDNTALVTAAFSSGFRDYDPDITAGISDRISNLELKLEDDIDSKIESYLIKRSLAQLPPQ